MVSTDQLHHLLEAVNERNLRTATVSFENSHGKSVNTLIYEIESGLRHVVDTMDKLRKNISQKREDFRKLMDAESVMEERTEMEYIALRDRYQRLLSNSLLQLDDDMDLKEKVQSDNFEKSLIEMEKLRLQYISVDPSLFAGQYAKTGHRHIKSVAKRNNLNALKAIEQRFAKTHELALTQIKRFYDAKLMFPIKSLEERRRFCMWRRRYCLEEEANLYLILAETEKQYEEIIETMSQDVFELSELYTVLRFHTHGARAYSKQSASSRFFSGDTLHETLKIGTKIRLMGMLTEMTDEDIKNILGSFIPKVSRRL